MLKKCFRGLTRGDFGILKEKGKRVYSTWLMASVMESDRLGVGVIVSKKVSTRAVDRNRIRRKIMEGIKNRLGEKKLKLVIIPRQEILRGEKIDIEAETRKIAEQL